MELSYSLTRCDSLKRDKLQASPQGTAGQNVASPGSLTRNHLRGRRPLLGPLHAHIPKIVRLRHRSASRFSHFHSSASQHTVQAHPLEFFFSAQSRATSLSPSNLMGLRGWCRCTRVTFFTSCTFAAFLFGTILVLLLYSSHCSTIVSMFLCEHNNITLFSSGCCL